jgi:Cadherin domain
VAENILPGTVILRVTADDLDTGQNALVRYVIKPHDKDSELFSINSHTGHISTAKNLDRELHDELTFQVGTTFAKYRLILDSVLSLSNVLKRIIS